MLVDALSKLSGTTLRLRTATLSAYTTGPGRATVTLAGGTVTGVPYLASYTPTVGDVVLLLQTHDQMVILGKTA